MTAEVVPFVRPEKPVEPTRPFIQDGICFCELWALDPVYRELLIERGLVWLTEFERGSGTYGGSIIAGDWAHAEAIAHTRNLGERVIGQLAAIVPYNSA